MGRDDDAAAGLVVSGLLPRQRDATRRPLPAAETRRGTAHDPLEPAARQRRFCEGRPGGRGTAV